MSSPKIHIIQSLSASALLYPVIGMNVIPFGVTAVLSDIDHVFDYVINTKNFHPRGLFVYHDILFKNINKNYLAIALFHTVEFHLFVLLLAYWYPFCYYIAMGLVFHHIADQIFFIRLKHPFKRASSIIEYLIRRKNYVTSLQEMVQQGDVNIEGIPDADKWLTKWGIQGKSAAVDIFSR